MRRFATAAILFAVVGMGAQAGGEKFGIGSSCPNFKDLPGVDGKKHSLNQFKKDVLVICITCNHCPVAVAYEDRIINFVKKHGNQIDFVAINVNNGAADKLDKMIVRAQEKGFNFPYLYDETQEIGRALGASVTPELFVLDKNRKVVYTGSFDNSQNAAKATTNFVEQAVQAALSGSAPATAQTRPFGCSVKYEKK